MVILHSRARYCRLRTSIDPAPLNLLYSLFKTNNNNSKPFLYRRFSLIGSQEDPMKFPSVQSIGKISSYLPILRYSLISMLMSIVKHYGYLIMPGKTLPSLAVLSALEVGLITTYHNRLESDSKFFRSHICNSSIQCCNTASNSTNHTAK